ncbi:hypothetical protein MGU_11312 [Metarhizium guizhouense ARSEF 977]|uniref:Uncharacterized protein n=1 Tax=Metarhizium guizhouense (strain ARSEF 977) TaxID=1276136 RepID=A0A0B4HPF9_METGA|nr:hypothetical protein MGU_11312 [Metarhizium guizhouense ARSEF 977]
MKTTPLLLASLACLTIAGPIRERQNTPSWTPTKALPQAPSQNEKSTAEKKDQLCAGFDNDDACKSVAKACSKELKDKNQPQDWSSLIRCVDRRRPRAVNVNPGINAAALATETSKPAPANTAGGSLKPFKNPASSAVDLAMLCGANGAFIDGFTDERRRSENCVGTERFCKEAFYEGTEETFASPEECLASRQPVN